MPIALGLDLGTTTLTALALDALTGRQKARVTAGIPREANVSPPGHDEHPRSEWDAPAIARAACGCLGELASKLSPTDDLAGLAITGQQHGVVLVDSERRPLGPFINWQDRRGDDLVPGTSRTWVETARLRLGEDAPGIAGCKLATGYMGLTLFWLAEQGRLPEGATACFLVDYLAALLTEKPPVTDATLAASSGLLDVFRGDQDQGLIDALGLPRGLFPLVRPAGERIGPLTEAMARETGLPPGLPVFVGLGDNQASFLGSVSQRDSTTLVNVGTGGQVAAFSPEFSRDAELETRPFPGGGFLLVSAGLVGGTAYAALERFFQIVCTDLLGHTSEASLFDSMTRLASNVPAGADGLVCEPFFNGTRQRPEVRATWSGMSLMNFTPGHMARALLEGVARILAASAKKIHDVRGAESKILVGSGNGIRDNPLLARIIGAAFHRPLMVPQHREEAATGAALVAAVGAGCVASLEQAGRLLLHDVVR